MTDVLLIDLSAIAHQLYHVSGSEPDPNWTSIKTVECVRALASGRSSRVAIAAEGGRSFRKDIDPSYKASRPESQPALQHQIATALETLRADGFPCWSAPTFEADDVIATACGTALIRDDVTVTIATSDKDLLQLVSDRVQVKSLRDGSLLGNAEVMAKLSVRPDQVRDYLALVGDASDNIKGANGIGPKKAAELLTKYGNLEDVYAALTNHGTQFTPSMATALREFEPRLKMVRDLITLRTDAPVPIEELWRERMPQDVAVFGDDESMGIASDIEESMPTLQETTNGKENMDGHREGSDGRADAPSVGDRSGTRPSDARGGADHRATEHDRTQTTAARGDQGLSQHATSGANFSHQGLAGTEAAPSRPALSTKEDVPFAELLSRPVAFSHQLEPTNYAQAKAVATDMHASRLFSAYGSPAAVLATIMAGRELGLQTMASLRGFHVIEGKQAMNADLIRARALTYEHCEYFRCTERTAEKATFTTKRKGDPEVTLTYTLEEGRIAFGRDTSNPAAKLAAERAWAASGWGKNPADMCVARASSKLARLVYPERVHGFYAPEEMD